MVTRDKLLAARQSRVRKLLQKWSWKSRKISKANAEVATLRAAETMKPSRLRKLVRWWEQIACLQKEEQDIISEIKFVEQRHQGLRRAKKLRPIEPAREPEEPPRPKDRASWFWVLLVWMIDANERKRRNTPL